MRTPIGISFSPDEVAAMDAEVKRQVRRRPYDQVSRSSFVREAVAAALSSAPNPEGHADANIS